MMDLWTQILTVPGMGGMFVLTLIALWVIFLFSMVRWIAQAPRES